MMITVLKSKIHNAVVTGAKLDYVGSITIDRRLVEAAGLIENEKVLVSDLTNGGRFETYVIVGEDEGVVEVNGAAAKIADRGDRIIVMSFALMEKLDAITFKPKVVVVDEKNRIIK